MFARVGTSVSSRFSVNSSNHSGRSRKRFPAACWLFFLKNLVLGLVFWEARKRFPDACSSLRKLDGLEEVLEASCGNDVQDELALELDDNPGQQQARHFPSCTEAFPILGQMWRSTTAPLIGKSVFFAELSK